MCHPLSIERAFGGFPPEVHFWGNRGAGQGPVSGDGPLSTFWSSRKCVQNRTFSDPCFWHGSEVEGKVESGPSPETGPRGRPPVPPKVDLRRKAATPSAPPP